MEFLKRLGCGLFVFVGIVVSLLAFDLEVLRREQA